MMASMEITWDSIIDACGGTGEVAVALSQRDSTVSGWRTRGIPGPHWVGILGIAAARGKSEITSEVLAKLAARKLADLDEARA
jgi:hypothetical protein